MSFDHCVKSFFNSVWKKSVVGIKKRNNRAGRKIKTDVARGAKSFVLLMNDANSRIVLDKSVANLPRPVGRTVVDHKDLKILISLRDDAFEAFFQIRTHVVNRNNHADKTAVIRVVSVMLKRLPVVLHLLSCRSDLRVARDRRNVCYLPSPFSAEARLTLNVKYVSGYGSFSNVKCHHSSANGLNPDSIMTSRNNMRFLYCSSVTPA